MGADIPISLLGAVAVALGLAPFLIAGLPSSETALWLIIGGALLLAFRADKDNLLPAQGCLMLALILGAWTYGVVTEEWLWPGVLIGVLAVAAVVHDFDQRARNHESSGLSILRAVPQVGLALATFLWGIGWEDKYLIGGTVFALSIALTEGRRAFAKDPESEREDV